MSKSILAHCQCRAVSFESNEKPIVEVCCHCKDCRQALGSDFAELSFFKLEGIILQGELESHEFVSDSGTTTIREYCVQCQDVIFDRSEGFPELIGVVSGKILPPYKKAPSAHVWVQSKLAHVEIPNDLPQYEKGIPRVALRQAAGKGTQPEPTVER